VGLDSIAKEEEEEEEEEEGRHGGETAWRRQEKARTEKEMIEPNLTRLFITSSPISQWKKAQMKAGRREEAKGPSSQ